METNNREKTKTGTEPAASLVRERLDQLQQQRDRLAEIPAIKPDETVKQPIIKPAAPTWEELQTKLAPVVNLPGFMETRVRELFEAGHGAELLTLADYAQEHYTKSAACLFTASTSRKGGNWERQTLPFIQEMWQVRRNTDEVMRRLKLAADSIKQIYALAWRLRGTLMRFLGIATEKGTGIRNPVGLFFALTKRSAAAT